MLCNAALCYNVNMHCLVNVNIRCLVNFCKSDSDWMQTEFITYFRSVLNYGVCPITAGSTNVHTASITNDLKLSHIPPPFPTVVN